MLTLPTISPTIEQNRQRRGLRRLRRIIGTRSRFVLHGQGSPHRDALQAYIATCFARAYRAEVTEFAPLLLELRCAGKINGVAGIRPADRSPLFLEHYLDDPVERVAATLTGQPIERREIVELGNLAALRPGACQLINIILAATLHDAGFRYAGLVSTAKLERILRRQHFSVQNVVAADPARLGRAAAKWGGYYDSDPKVIWIDLAKTVAALHEQRLPAAICLHFAATIDQLAGQIRMRNDTPD
jgi:hypothetical protein